MSKQIFVKPYDIFMPRGNSHFGVNSGDFGQVKMLPAPSIFAGAFRSYIASRDSEVLAAISRGEKPKNHEYAEVLGSLADPGSFKITNVCLAINQAEKFETVFSLPDDLVIFEENNKVEIKAMSPAIFPKIFRSEQILPKVAILRAPSRKPTGGYFFKQSGYVKYLAGEIIMSEDLIKESELWNKETRVGIALDPKTRSAQEGMLYSAEALSFKDNAGFIVTISGADQISALAKGDLSLGGDQRASNFKQIQVSIPEVDYKKIEQNKKFKLLLTSPAMFSEGWVPDNVKIKGSDYILSYKNCKAKLVCASIKGYETLSGWNMVKKMPKTAVKTVPAGSVYWFEDFEGDISSLKDLINNGIWNDNLCKQRVAEGYNRAVVAAYNN